MHSDNNNRRLCVDYTGLKTCQQSFQHAVMCLVPQGAPACSVLSSLRRGASAITVHTGTTEQQTAVIDYTRLKHVGRSFLYMQ
jgi:hypothetical protein